MESDPTATSYDLLAEALRERRHVIADHAWRDADPAGHLNALRSAAEKIEAAAESLPGDCPRHLRHYLDNKSYDKALALVEGG